MSGSADVIGTWYAVKSVSMRQLHGARGMPARLTLHINKNLVLISSTNCHHSKPNNSKLTIYQELVAPPQLCLLLFVVILSRVKVYILISAC